jgi:hypothetical protein
MHIIVCWFIGSPCNICLGNPVENNLDLNINVTSGYVNHYLIKMGPSKNYDYWLVRYIRSDGVSCFSSDTSKNGMYLTKFVSNTTTKL